MAGPSRPNGFSALKPRSDNVAGRDSSRLEGGADPIIAVKMAVALMQFWMLRGYSSEGRKLVRSALRCPRFRFGPCARMGTLCRRRPSRKPKRYGEARDMLERCLALRRRLGNTFDIAATLSTLSLVRLPRAMWKKPPKASGRRCGFSGKSDDRPGELVGLVHLGQIAQYLGDDEEARSCLEQAFRSPETSSIRNLRVSVNFGSGNSLSSEGIERCRALVQTVVNIVPRGRRPAGRGQRDPLARQMRRARGDHGFRAGPAHRGVACIPEIRDVGRDARVPRGRCRALPARSATRAIDPAVGGDAARTRKTRLAARAQSANAPDGTDRRLSSQLRGELRKKPGTQAAPGTSRTRSQAPSSRPKRVSRQPSCSGRSAIRR